jgi:SAM-dependent methyltransferase
MTTGDASSNFSEESTGMASVAEKGARACPQCGCLDCVFLRGYSLPPWQLVQCSACSFVFLRNPPAYERLVSEYAWEKSRLAEKERRIKRSRLLAWFDRRTRWRLDVFSPRLSGRLKSLWRQGPVLDVGCGAGHRVPQPYIPIGIEISEVLWREADINMRARGGRAIHAPAIEGIKELPDHYFTGILLRSFLEHEAQPKALLRECARVLAVDGAIYVRVPNYGSLNRRIRGAKWCGFRFPDHVNYFDSKSLLRMAEDCGLSLTLINALRLPFDDNINAVFRLSATTTKATLPSSS